ncbi:MAG: CapA family protein [Candidatus Eisenbacteria bacterium]|nr:CapA family protein [Candidatus Eisenbacteria bacterium]
MRLLEAEGALRLTLAAVGDVGVLGSVRRRAASEGPDAPFAALAPHARAADLAFANLEFPVGERAWVRPGRADEFFHDAGVPAALARAGFRVVSLANNHMMDCGERGLARTLDACRSAGLAAVGAGADLEAARTPARIEVRGVRVVVLAYATAGGDAATSGRAGVAPLEPELVAADLARWRPQADVLVVSVHWGSMYVDFPPPRVVGMAKSIAAAGADLVLGHHPHVLQGAARVGRTLVLYSMGDAVFDGRSGDFEASVAALTRRESGVFTARFGESAHGLELAALKLDPDGVPGEPAGTEARAQAERFAALSAGLADAAARFAAEGAPKLLQYELQSLGTYLRQGRWDRVAKLLGGVRPRHLPLLWQAVTRRGRGRTPPAAR